MMRVRLSIDHCRSRSAAMASPPTSEFGGGEFLRSGNPTEPMNLMNSSFAARLVPQSRSFFAASGFLLFLTMALDSTSHAVLSTGITISIGAPLVLSIGAVRSVESPIAYSPVAAYLQGVALELV